ncbi:MAG: hypothetical protein QGI70_08225 [Paracoccaceae bacterium]|nr:hypothetical protein [Paracoccaceae bacterium]
MELLDRNTLLGCVFCGANTGTCCGADAGVKARVVVSYGPPGAEHEAATKQKGNIRRFIISPARTG